MQRTCHRILAAAAALLLATAATAAPEYAGSHGVNPCVRAIGMAFEGAAGTVIDHVYEFVLSGRHDAMAAGVVVEGPVGFQFRNAMVTLWRSNGDTDYANDELLGGFDFGTAAVAQAFNALPAGRYFWRIEGIADGSRGKVLVTTGLADGGRCRN